MTLIVFIFQCHFIHVFQNDNDRQGGLRGVKRRGGGDAFSASLAASKFHRRRGGRQLQRRRKRPKQSNKRPLTQSKRHRPLTQNKRQQRWHFPPWKKLLEKIHSG